MNTIDKDMKNVMCAFEFNNGDKICIGHKKIKVHMIFDVKMMSLTRTARLVAGGALQIHLKSQFKIVYSKGRLYA